MSNVKNIAAACPKTKFALVGYSQGASVVRWAIRDLPDSLKDKVVLVGLIGDPERRGFNQTTPEIGHHVFFTSGTTMYGSGALGAGPVLPKRRGSAVVTACHLNDDICNRSGAFSMSAHTGYYQSTTGASKIGSGFYIALFNNGFR